MTDRLYIEFTSDLPEVGKYAILASAEEAAKDFAAAMATKHPGVDLRVSVKAIRPGKKVAAPIVQATTLAPDPMRQRPAAE